MWFITGALRGLGLAVIDDCDIVAANARDQEDIAHFKELYSESVKIYASDVTKPETIKQAFKNVSEFVRWSDVMVNNAGYGLIGTVEEVNVVEYRALYEFNVFGLIETTRAALPILRQRSGSRIVSMSFIAKVSGGAGSGFHSSTKLVVEGLSESLNKEVSPVGIKVIIVEPGLFRTNFFLGLWFLLIVECRNMSRRRGRKYRESNNGRQAGDPYRVAKVIVATAKVMCHHYSCRSAKLHIP